MALSMMARTRVSGRLFAPNLATHARSARSEMPYLAAYSACVRHEEAHPRAIRARAASSSSISSRLPSVRNARPGPVRYPKAQYDQSAPRKNATKDAKPSATAR